MSKEKEKVYYNHENGDRFVVMDMDTGEVMRGVVWAHKETGEYGQLYYHALNANRMDFKPKGGRFKRPPLAIRIMKGNISIDPFPPTGTKRWDFITNLVNENEWKIGAEIGLAKGGNTYQMINRCPALELVAVDFWPGFDEEGNVFHTTAGGNKAHPRRRGFMQKYKKHPGRVRLIEKPSIEAAKDVEDESLDFVFIDAEHSKKAVMADIKAWLPKVKETGMLLGHDANWYSVAEGVEESLGEVNVWWYDNVWWVWKKDIKKKRATRKKASTSSKKIKEDGVEEIEPKDGYRRFQAVPKSAALKEEEKESDKADA